MVGVVHVTIYTLASSQWRFEAKTVVDQVEKQGETKPMTATQRDKEKILIMDATLADDWIFLHHSYLCSPKRL